MVAAIKYGNCGWRRKSERRERERERQMDGEIQSFVKVWSSAILSLCYCYFIAGRIPKGFMRLISLLPILSFFILLPLNLSSFHLCGPTAFFLSWLCNFKLLLFSFDLGPLSPPPPNPLHFIAVASLPIKLTQSPPPNPEIHEKSKTHFLRKAPASVFMAVKALLLALVILAYEFRPFLHPSAILFLYICHMYLGLDIVLGLFAALCASVGGFELEPQFNKPYLSTSLQDFWGRRWNLMVPIILRPTVYFPIVSISTSFLGPKWAPLPAMIAAFTVSGLMHELIYYYLTRVSPTWEVTWFFVMHGVFTVVEVAAKKVVPRQWRLHPAVSGLMTVALLMVTARWLFLPQLERNNVIEKAISEYPIMVNFFKDLYSWVVSKIGL